MDYLIMISDVKYLHFGKRQKHVARKFFFHRVEVTGSMCTSENFFELSVSQI